MANVIEIPKLILYPSLEIGGDLPENTTYYFTGWLGQGAGYYGGVWGEAADEVSITTTAADQKIVMEWGYEYDGSIYNKDNIDNPNTNKVFNEFLELIPDSIAGTGSHRTGWFIKWDYYTMKDPSGNFYKWCNLNDPEISDEFQDITYGHRRWCNYYANNGFRVDSVDITTSTMTPTRDFGTFGHSQLAWQYSRDPVYGPIDMTKSDIVIIADEGDDECDIINALEQCDYKDRFFIPVTDNRYSYNSDARLLIIKGGIVGTATITLNTLMLITVAENMIHNPNITYNDCKILTNTLTGSFWMNPRGTYNNTTFQHTGNAFILDNVTANNFNPWCRAGTTNYGAIDGLYIDHEKLHQWRYFKNNMPVSNTTFKDSYVYATADAAPHDYTGENAITWTNVSFIEITSYVNDITVMYSYNLNEDAQDEINCYNVTTDREDGKLLIRFVNPTYPNDPYCKWTFYQPFSCNIQKNDGTEIEGATVLIVDDSSTEYSLTTTETGDCSTWINTYNIEMDENNVDGYTSGTTPFYSKTTDNNPMVLRVSKDGYNTYEIPITLTEETSLEIALNETDPPVYVDRDISGTVSSQEVTGTIQSTQISGSIETINLTGTIEQEE